MPLFFISAESAAAFLISPSEQNVEFSPGGTEKIELTVMNNDHIRLELSVEALPLWLDPSVQSELMQSVQLNDSRIVFAPSEYSKTVAITLTFPATLSKSGIHEIRIPVTEAGSTGQVGSRASNVMRLLVHVNDEFVLFSDADSSLSDITSEQPVPPPILPLIPSPIQPNQRLVEGQITEAKKSALQVTDSNSLGTLKQPANSSASEPNHAETASTDSVKERPLVQNSKLPLLLLGGLLIFLLGSFAGPQLISRFAHPIEAVFFFVPSVKQGNIMPCKLLVKNKSIKSLYGVKLFLQVKDLAGNVVTKVQPPPVTIRPGEEMISIPLQTKNLPKGNYLFEIYTKHDSKTMRSFANAALF